jgi:hypothetical protein
MAESSHYFWICGRNSILGFDVVNCTQCIQLMKSADTSSAKAYRFSQNPSSI